MSKDLCEGEGELRAETGMANLSGCILRLPCCSWLSSSLFAVSFDVSIDWLLKDMPPEEARVVVI